ncbi:hypothetical protein AB7M22_004361 [Pseudomonas sp. ADAK2 TE3594]
MSPDTPPSRAGSLPQLNRVHLREIGRLSGRLRGQASLLQVGRRTSARDWAAVRPSSRASLAPTSGSAYVCEGLGGCQAAFAGKPRSYKWVGVCLREIGRLSDRLRGQASLLQVGRCMSERDWLAVRPPSRASPHTVERRTPAFHHSTGRALARLQLLIWLLILIHPPLREAERRCSSGDWRAAPFDAVEPIACRS